MAAVILAQKLLLALALLLAPFLVPSRFPNSDQSGRRFKSYDTQPYLDIAAKGYYEGGRECAFYPLWPLCIRIGSILLAGHPLLAAYLLANLFSFAGLLLFHRFVWTRHNLPLANRATLLLLFFPGSIFFFVPYSESLFLLLLMMVLLGWQQGRYWVAAAGAFYLPLTRAIGIFILPVLLWELWRSRSRPAQYAVGAAPMAGYLTYFLVMYAFTGNAFEGFKAQEQYPARPSIVRIFDPAGFVEHFGTFNWTHSMLHSWLDRLLFLAFLASLFCIWRLDSGYFIYSLSAGLVPALSNVLMSYTRFLSIVFPVFIVFAWVTERRWLFSAALAASAAGQFYFLLRHISQQWAG